MPAKWVAGVGQQCSYRLKISQLVDSYNGLVWVANKRNLKRILLAIQTLLFHAYGFFFLISEYLFLQIRKSVICNPLWLELLLGV